MVLEIMDQLVYLPQVVYHIPSSKVHLFSPQVSHQSCKGKNIIFGFQIKIHLSNQIQTDITIDIIESNVPFVQNSRCTETEKKTSGFSLGGRSSYAGQHYLTDALIGNTNSIQESLDH